MKKPSLFLLAFISLSTCLTAQTIDDALRYSQNTLGGTARGMGIAGAFGALGADFTTTSINPAGIGLSRKSEFVLTPSLLFRTSEGTYLGETIGEKESKFHFNNLGLTLANLSGNNFRKGSPWRAVNYALGFNRLKDFHSKTTIQGFNTNSSLTDYYIEKAGDIIEEELIDQRPFDAGLAYFNYLINPSANGGYFSIIPSANIQQQDITTTKGAMDEYTMAIGANYRDNLYIGASLGIPRIKYTLESIFSETDVTGNITNEELDFESFTQIDNLSVSGFGINAKLGAIYRFHQFFRGGLSFHTPSLLSIDEEYSTGVEATYSNFEVDDELPDFAQGSYSYRIQTPWKLVASGAFFAGRHGFISVDYELIDYQQMEFLFSENESNVTQFENELNRKIEDTYQMTSNIKIGAELALQKFRLRAGYAYHGSPYATDASLNQQFFTSGLGIVEKGVSLDIAYVHALNKRFYQPYTLATGQTPEASVETTTGNLAFSVAVRF